jgi:hypothetical protein
VERQQLRAAIPAGNAGSEPPALIGAAGVAEGSLGRRDLPGPAVTTLPLVVRVLLNAHGFYSGETALSIAIAIGVISLVLVAAWTRMNRQVIVGADWIAWRPRVASRWYVLPYAQVVSLTVGHPNRLTPELVQVHRSDGRGIGLRPEEIRTGAGQPLLEAFLDRPAITDFRPSHGETKARYSE